MLTSLVRWFIVVLLGIGSQALYAAPASRIEATYDALAYGIKLIEVKDTYTRTQDHYRIESVSKAVGLLARIKPETIRVVSKGLVTAQGLRPLSYTNMRELDTERNTSATFNWGASTIIHKDYQGERSAALPAGTQDRLSAMYQFQFMLLQDNGEVKFTITNGRDLDHYSYRITPEQSISVPFGTYKTRYLATPPQEDGSTFEIWLAPELGNLPCKIVITDADGNKATQVLTHLSIVP
jgi:Protein of unknown function (DUF3108)